MENGPVDPGQSDTEDEYLLRLDFYLRELTDADVSRRWKAAESLARLGDERGVGPLMERLSDEDWRVRQKAAWALGQIGDPRALMAIRAAMRQETEGVREIMEEAVRNILARQRGEEPPPPR